MLTALVSRPFSPATCLPSAQVVARAQKKRRRTDEEDGGDVSCLGLCDVMVGAMPAAA